MTDSEDNNLIKLKNAKDTSRYSFFPIEDSKKLYKLYTKQIDAFWTTREIDLTKDPNDWKLMPTNVRNFIKKILAFFSQIDAIVIENIGKNFQEKTSDIKEAGNFYNIQNAIETIHNEMYGLLIVSLIEDIDERKEVLDAIKNYDYVRKIALWMTTYMDEKKPIMEQIVAFACIEGVLFVGAFCAIYWIKHFYKDKLNGLTQSNEFIARDENIHKDAGVEIYKTYIRERIHDRLPDEVFYSIIDSAVDIAKNFIDNILETDFFEMNRENMLKYIKCTANTLCLDFGYPKRYDAKNPFEWCIMIGTQNKTNFFEKKVTEYRKVTETKWNFNISANY